jgi:multidrug resistance protein
LIATVIFLTAIAPLATDMYVPAFPRVAGDLSASATQVQLTLTTFFVGMALGQLIGGPVSDQRGRRRPLLAALVLMTVASIVCALTPSIGVMMVARLVQGFTGGWAMVIGRAIIVDLATGDRLVRVLNVIAGVGGVAPIAGPLLGAVILQLSHWRVSFWTVAALSVVMLVAVPESLPQDKRHSGGLRAFAVAGRQVLANRRYVGYLPGTSRRWAAAPPTGNGCAASTACPAWNGWRPRRAWIWAARRRLRPRCRSWPGSLPSATGVPAACCATRGCRFARSRRPACDLAGSKCLSGNRSGCAATGESAAHHDDH